MHKNLVYMGIFSLFLYSENINSMSDSDSNDSPPASSKKFKSPTAYYGPSLEDVPFQKPQPIGRLGDRSNLKYDERREMYYQGTNLSDFPKSPSQERVH